MNLQKNEKISYDVGIFVYSYQVPVPTVQVSASVNFYSLGLRAGAKFGSKILKKPIRRIRSKKYLESATLY